MPNLAFCKNCGSINRGFDNPGCMNEDCNEEDVELFINSHGQFGFLATVKEDVLEYVVNSIEREEDRREEFSETFLDFVGVEWLYNGNEYTEPTLDGVKEFCKFADFDGDFTDEKRETIKEEAEEKQDKLEELFEDIVADSVISPHLDFRY